MYNKKYYQKNKEKKIKYQRKYYKENRERYKKYLKERRLKRKQLPIYIAEYIELHKEEIEQLKKQREKERRTYYNAIYFQKNKEKIYKKRGVKI